MLMNSWPSAGSKLTEMASRTLAAATGGSFFHHHVAQCATTATNADSETKKFREGAFVRPKINLAPLCAATNRMASAWTDSVSHHLTNLRFRLGTDPRWPPVQRKKVVVLGTGWAAVNFITRLDVRKYDVTIVSPRNYFTFTPLLPSVCAGTLSARSCMEPVRDKMLRGGKSVMTLHEAWASRLDETKKMVTCTTASNETFDIPYDYLVIAVGAETNTFGIPGVTQHAHFLKELENAQAIHRKILDNFEKASLPTTSEEEKKRLLHFVVVGGGPTGVETAAEISDFVKEDVRRHMPELVNYAKVTLIEMLPRVLPMFNEKVSDFTLANMQKKLKVDALLRCRVTEITENTITVVDASGKEQKLPQGFVLWASGVGQVPFVKELLEKKLKPAGSRLMKVNERLQVEGLKDVYAMGDCALFSPKPLVSAFGTLVKEAESSPEGLGKGWLVRNAQRLSRQYPQISPAIFDMKQLPDVEGVTREEFKALLQKVDAAFKPPPPTAQNANQEGRYLANSFNHFVQPEEKNKAPAYVFQYRGSMAYVGDRQSVIQSPTLGTLLGGRFANLLWKGFYWSQQMSFTNRFICTFDWLRTRACGRDFGRDHAKPLSTPPALQP